MNFAPEPTSSNTFDRLVCGKSVELGTGKVDDEFSGAIHFGRLALVATTLPAGGRGLSVA